MRRQFVIVTDDDGFYRKIDEVFLSGYFHFVLLKIWKKINPFKKRAENLKKKKKMRKTKSNSPISKLKKLIREKGSSEEIKQSEDLIIESID